MNDWRGATSTCERWIVRGAIRTISPLGSRTGAATKITKASADPEQVEQWMHEIDRDHLGRPVIAASTLKGIVRSLLSERCRPEHRRVIEQLFGHTARTIDGREEQGGRAGRAEFRNAFVDTGVSVAVGARSMVSIDRGTGAAADGRLRTQAVVEPGALFAIEIVLDGVAEADVAFLVAALRLFDGSGGSAIGGGTRQGFGRVAWQTERETIQRLDAAAIAAWVAEDSAGDWRQGNELSGDDLHAFRRRVDEVGLREAADGPRLDLHLAFDGFFLVSQMTELGHKREDDADRHPLVLRRDGELPRPLLPGSGFKGPLRAQAERIWRTLTGDLSGCTVSFVQELFGGEGRAGALRCSDFIGKPTPLRRHELVAIDRFTGGAAEGQKFSHDVFEAPALSGELSIDLARGVDREATGKPPGEMPPPLSKPAIGLLALVLRDLAEGDIAFGFGVRKGYGRIASVEANGRDPLQALAECLVTDEVSGEERIKTAVASFREAASRRKREIEGT